VDVPQLITGKSVLCAYLIRLLRSRGYTPAFFFFGHEKRAKPSVSTFLRTSAAHIASSNPAILGKIFNICARNPDLAEADAGKVWRKLFSDCILKHPSDQRYYWMIDGLDECKGERDLVGYIMQAARNEKFRIFVTSRTTPDSYEFLKPRNKVCADKSTRQQRIQTSSCSWTNAQSSLQHKMQALYTSRFSRKLTAVSFGQDWHCESSSKL
jgi:hypothetical protein